MPHSPFHMLLSFCIGGGSCTFKRLLFSISHPNPHFVAQYYTFCRYHFVYAPCQWETTLQYNIVSHWQGTYTKWSLILFCVLQLSHSHTVIVQLIYVYKLLLHTSCFSSCTQSTYHCLMLYTYMQLPLPLLLHMALHILSLCMSFHIVDKYACILMG